MKLRKLMSFAAATAIVASVASVSASAADFDWAAGGHFVCLASDSADVPVLQNKALAADIRTINMTIQCKNKDFEKAVLNGDTWYGGGFGVNSKSTTWKALAEWSIQEGAKPLTWKQGEKRYQYTLTYTTDAPIVTANEDYCYFWLQDWSHTYEKEITLVDFELLNADGVDIRDIDAGATAPAETEKPADTTAPVEVEEPVVTEPTEEAVVTVEADFTAEAETVEVDTEEVTADTEEVADADVNDYFDGGTVYLKRDDGFEGYIDATGADITEIYGVKFNVTFDDAEVANDEVWVGGGVGPNANSTGWEMHEWGKESGMKEIIPDFENGTITWFKGEPIFTDAEEYAQLWIQTWGGTVTVESVELLYADYDGSDIVEPSAPAEETPADTAADDTVADKGNPDTGVAGVAVAAGVVALAGAAVVVSRKRK
ncbi:MAG: NPXTG-anchored protein [Oscillospiraceae bacterium]